MPTNKLNYGEWGELYTLLRLVGAGRLSLADEHEREVSDSYLELKSVIRHETNSRKVSYDEGAEHDGYRDVDIRVNEEYVTTARSDAFNEEADDVFSYVGKGLHAPFPVTDELDGFFHSIEVLHYKAPSTDKSDIFLTVLDPRTALVREEIGYSIKTKWSKKSTLFNTGNGSRAVFKVTGPMTTSFADEINALLNSAGDADVSGRVHLLESKGCGLSFSGFAYCERARCRAFQENLETINPRLVEVWARVIRAHFDDGLFTGETTAIAAIGDWLIDENPCDVGRPGVDYPYMIKSFLYAAYCGLTASTLWDGRSNVNGGLITVDSDGKILAFNALDGDVFKTYLYTHCCIDFPSTSRGHGNYGSVYQEGGEFYFDLNFQIRFNRY